jgi:ABC-type nitrate/sulfonate/bicarbonate transport system substrate-binding protein
VASALGLVPCDSFAGLRIASSDEQFEALTAGRVELVVTAMDNVIAWNRRPGPGDFRIVAQMEHTTPLQLIGRPGMRELAELRGGTVLVDARGNGFVVALRAMLADAGLGADSYALHPAGGVKERFDALLAGQGSCTLLGPPFDSLALVAGMVCLAVVQQRYPAFPGQGLVMRASAIERLRAALSAWLHGIGAASQRMEADDPGVRQALVSAGFPVAALPALLAMRPRSLWPDREGVALIVDHRRQLGLPGGDDSYDELVDTCLLPVAAGAPP